MGLKANTGAALSFFAEIFFMTVADPLDSKFSTSFSPYGTRDKSRQCKYCAHFVEMTDTAAVCNEDGTIHVRSMPENGCVFFVRETGTDDDLV